ncbi:MAG: right-handed parallel beta-helix repeat-containing protein [Promethearchaeota archaeon]
MSSKALISHPSIYIDGNDDLDSFFAGNNTDGLLWETAFLIENLEIDAGGSGSAIRIINTTRYLIIAGCLLKNSGDLFWESGIDIRNCRNIKIMNNIVENCNIGINVVNSFNVTVAGSTITNCTSGIYLYLSGSVILENNRVYYNNKSGVYLWGCRNNSIVSNEIYQNDLDGILLKYSDNNNISSNVVNNNNRYGIYLDISENNSVFDNIVYGNTDDNILESEHDSNNIFENKFSHPNPMGVIEWLIIIIILSFLAFVGFFAFIIYSKTHGTRTEDHTGKLGLREKDRVDDEEEMFKEHWDREMEEGGALSFLDLGIGTEGQGAEEKEQAPDDKDANQPQDHSDSGN